jgi:hypothetical protein
MPLPFLPWAMPSPPPLPGGTRAVDSPVLPLNHPLCFGKAEDAGLQGGERAIDLPALQPSMCRTFRGPLDPLREIAPAAARDQHVEQGIHDLTNRVCGMPRPRWTDSGGKMSAKRCPSQSLKPSNLPAIIPSHPGAEEYGTEC